MRIEPSVVIERRPTTTRLIALDALRGLIMVFMAVDHASVFIAHRHSSEFWAGEVTRYSSVLPFLTRFVTHFCAPGFFFLMGCGMALSAQSRKRLGWSDGRVARFFLARGLLLVLINQLVENPAWLLGTMFQQGPPTGPPAAPGGGGMPFLVMGVLTGLGLTLAVGGLLMRLGMVAWLALSGTALWATSALIPPASQGVVLYPPWLRLLLIPGQTGFMLVLYPLVPWLALAGLGVAFAGRLGRSEQTAYRAAPWLGLALMLVAVGLRTAGGFGNIRLPRDGTWIEFLNFVKYPPALVFTLFMLGGNLIALGIFGLARERFAGLLQVLAVYGRTPLFFYLAHLYLYGLTGAIFFRRPVSLEAMYLVWLGGLVPLWFLCVRYRAFKESRPVDSIWRFF